MYVLKLYLARRHCGVGGGGGVASGGGAAAQPCESCITPAADARHAIILKIHGKKCTLMISP